jgi:hypothetical protein
VREIPIQFDDEVISWIFIELFFFLRRDLLFFIFLYYIFPNQQNVENNLEQFVTGKFPKIKSPQSKRAMRARKIVRALCREDPLDLWVIDFVWILLICECT